MLLEGSVCHAQCVLLAKLGGRIREEHEREKSLNFCRCPQIKQQTQCEYIYVGQLPYATLCIITVQCRGCIVAAATLVQIRAQAR